jgi:hypothetical protein
MASTHSVDPGGIPAPTPIIRAQIEAVAHHPSARPEDQAAARRWLRGMGGTTAPGLAWTPAIEQRCREQCMRAFGAMLGLSTASPAGPRAADRCSCGDIIEQDAEGPCCAGATPVPSEQRAAADVLGITRVTGPTLSIPQLGQVHAALAGAPVASMSSRQRILLAACERLMPSGMTDDVALALTIDEIRAVAAMSLEACRELVAAAWNDACHLLQAVS